jgi:hypothetical protein
LGTQQQLFLEHGLSIVASIPVRLALERRIRVAAKVGLSNGWLALAAPAALTAFALFSSITKLFLAVIHCVALIYGFVRGTIKYIRFRGSLLCDVPVDGSVCV